MNQLERRYRVLIRAFPRTYRRRVGDELIASLLAATDPVRSRPPFREAAALIVAGVRMRLTDELSRSRAAGRCWAAIVGVAMLSYVGMLVALVHLRGAWAEPLPRLFVPAWTMITIVPIAAALLRVPVVARRTLMFGSLAALLIGPSGTMVSRTMLFAAGWFVLLVSTAPRLKVLPVLGAIASGAAVGVVAANEVISRLPIRAPHLPWMITAAISWEDDVVSVVCIAAMILLTLASIVWPAIGITAGLCAVPTMLVLIATSDDLLFYGWRGQLESPPPTPTIAALAALCLLIATSRNDRRARRDVVQSPPGAA